MTNGRRRMIFQRKKHRLETSNILTLDINYLRSASIAIGLTIISILILSFFYWEKFIKLSNQL